MLSTENLGLKPGKLNKLAPNYIGPLKRNENVRQWACMPARNARIIRRFRKGGFLNFKGGD